MYRLTRAAAEALEQYTNIDEFTGEEDEDELPPTPQPPCRRPAHTSAKANAEKRKKG
jgi:hypothetical protein